LCAQFVEAVELSLAAQPRHESQPGTLAVEIEGLVLGGPVVEDVGFDERHRLVLVEGRSATDVDGSRVHSAGSGSRIALVPRRVHTVTGNAHRRRNLDIGGGKADRATPLVTIAHDAA